MSKRSPEEQEYTILCEDEIDTEIDTCEIKDFYLRQKTEKVANYKDHGAITFGWYLEAAEKGDIRAQYNLGTCYENGFGVKKDKFKE
ncbi:unnamed protein product [Rhizophagus irregularis]|nr:unnamed protein product [Rhizophagus irregularis]